MKRSRLSSSILSSLVAVATLGAQASRAPTARLVSASRFDLPARVDSNNPAVWSLVDGAPPNRFVLGGVGDVTAALDAESQDVY